MTRATSKSELCAGSDVSKVQQLKLPRINSVHSRNSISKRGIRYTDESNNFSSESSEASDTDVELQLTSSMVADSADPSATGKSTIFVAYAGNSSDTSTVEAITFMDARKFNQRRTKAFPIGNRNMRLRVNAVTSILSRETVDSNGNLFDPDQNKEICGLLLRDLTMKKAVSLARTSYPSDQYLDYLDMGCRKLIEFYLHEESHIAVPNAAPKKRSLEHKELHFSPRKQRIRRLPQRYTDYPPEEVTGSNMSKETNQAASTSPLNQSSNSPSPSHLAVAKPDGDVGTSQNLWDMLATHYRQKSEEILNSWKEIWELRYQQVDNLKRKVNSLETELNESVAREKRLKERVYQAETRCKEIEQNLEAERKKYRDSDEATQAAWDAIQKELCKIASIGK